MSTPTLDARLKLNTSEFDTNLEKSKKQVGKFRKDTDTASASITKSIGSIGVAALGAVATFETLNKIINSTQSTGDAFQKMVDQSTASLDLFFSSIAQGDMSHFINGLQTSIKEAGKLSVLLDNLGTNKMFSTPQLAKYDRDIAAQTAIVKDKSKSKEERKAAAERIKVLQAEKRAIKEMTAGQSLEAGYQGFRSGMADKGYASANMLTKGAIDQIMDNLRKGTAADKGAEYKALFDDIVKTTYDSQGRAVSTYKDADAQAKLDAFLSTNKGQMSAANYYASQAGDDAQSKLGQAVANLTYAYNAQTQLIQEETAQKRAENMIGGSSSGGGSKTSIPAIIESEFDPIATIQEGIDSKSKRVIIPFEFVPVEAEELAGDSFDFNGGINPFDNIKDVDLGDSLGQITNLANAIGSVNGAINSGAEGWINWAATLLASIAAAIPAISALIAIREVESQANAKAAITGAAASTASIPVVGWIMAGAAVASMTAALLSIPKFASGGIVGGASYSGDKIPALLNSGEMVLNSRQQSNLFSQLDRGNGNNNSGGQVEFYIKGDYLKGILNKTDKRKSRV